jgi:hypothetical protein
MSLRRLPRVFRTISLALANTASGLIAEVGPRTDQIKLDDSSTDAELDRLVRESSEISKKFVRAQVRSGIDKRRPVRE